MTDEQINEKIEHLTQRLDGQSNVVADLARNAALRGEFESHARRIESLNDALVELVKRIAAVETDLRGDLIATHIYEEQYAKWQRAKAGYEAPRMAEPQPPQPGLADIVDRLQTKIFSDNSEQASRFDAMTSAIRDKLKFVDRLEAFFEPVLRDKNPPMDAEQLASKSWIDKKLETLAGALRAEVDDARALANAIRGRQQELGIDKPVEAGFRNMWQQFVNRVLVLVQNDFERQRRAEEERNKPTRLQSLVYAVTGVQAPPRNGSHR